MKWVFLDKTILKEKDSGYIIELIEGTWRNPTEVRPIVPKREHYIRQAELLRCGLEFAYDAEVPEHSESA